jgi:outer membrane receptor protein involved in Fe transport
LCSAGSTRGVVPTPPTGNPAPLLKIVLLVCFVVLPTAVPAQDGSTGALRGTVVDAQGAAITTADVMAVRIENGLRYHVVTDGQGRFTFDLLPPGEYVARAEAITMSPQDSPRVRVEVGAAAELNFKLAVAGVKETVTVAESPETAETQASSLSSMVDGRAITELPLNGRRFTDLSLLTAGVTQDPRGLNSASNGDLSFGGIRGYQSSYLVDGADNNNGFFAQARGRYRAPYQFSNEVVQEFRISSNSYGAEMGRAGGAVVNVVTKSGTNTWHGTGFYFLRDSALGATPGFLKIKPGDQQHQFGATLGGPIRRNKAFIFAGFDEHIFRVPAVVQFVNGQTTVTPKWNFEPSRSDYEICDPAIGGSACDQAIVPGCPPSNAGGPPCDPASVAPASAQLSAMGGTFRARMVGNAGFVKLDYALTSHQYLTARLSTSRYSGANNVYLDAASPITNNATSGNGEEDVKTESASLALISGLTPRLTSHLRAQFSRDLQLSTPNSTDVRTSIHNLIDSFGQSAILPRQTREHRLHVAETLSLNAGRHDWKVGGDTMLTWDYNYYPALFGGEYIFNYICVDQWTFAPQASCEGNQLLRLTPLRAWAHSVMASWDFDQGAWNGQPANVPRYYVQNFGSPISHPNSNDYAAFAQDTIRLTNRLALSLGVRYDWQTFSSRELVSNPLWPATGKMPSNGGNVAPRVGIAYAIGNRHPLVMRGGFGVFYTRLPQMYESVVINNNGLHSGHLFLDNAKQSAIFPTYPNPLVNCVRGPAACLPPDSLKQDLTSDIAAFAPNFRTPRVQQASLTLEKELGDRFIGGVSYLYVHGVDLIRARDVNLPPPVQYSYPVYDSNDNFLNTFYPVNSFATWQKTPSGSCFHPPCINDMVRPIPQLGAINQFESAGSSVYHGFTASVRRRVASGIYFRLAYTWAHAIDDGQDALVAGRPAIVQNSFSTQSERGPGVTDQRHRLSISSILEPHPFDRGQPLLGRVFNGWKISGLTTFNSGRPVEAQVYGDANRDENSDNDRLPGYGRNAFRGPDYASTDLRLSRKLKLSECCRMELTAESFNVFNRNNKREYIFDRGFVSTATDFIMFRRFVKSTNTYYPAYFQQSANFMQPTRSFAPRQVQMALRLIF